MTLKVIIGIILLLINIPIGWLGLTYFICYAKKTKNKIYYFFAIVIYVLSWILLALGIYLCGERYAKLVLNHPITKYLLPLIIIFIIIYMIYRFKKTLNKNL